MFLKSAIALIGLAACSVLAQVQQQTFKLVDGATIVGRLVAPQDKHVQVALDSGGTTPTYTNIPWARLSQETVQQLADSPNQNVSRIARIFLDPPPQQQSVAGSKRITVKPVPRLDRPKDGSLFASQVMLLLFFLIYAANIYAGWEIGIFRQWPPAMVAGLSAVLPIIAPVIFIALPTHRVRREEMVEWVAPVEEAPVAAEEAAAPVEAAPAKAEAPQPIVYPRGQFTFNRRFFETKFAGFLKVVPGEAERDKIIFIKSARGEYTGQRLTKIEPNELYLQIRKGTATEDVMIPFSEIYEVQVKPKDV